MSNRSTFSRPAGLLFVCILLCCAAGCSSDSKSTQNPAAAESQSLRDNTPKVLTPLAAGESICGNDLVDIDTSNSSSGYLVLTYQGSNPKVKFQITDPEEQTCTYPVTTVSEPIVYPLTGGSGSYLLTLLESADSKKDLYAIVFSEEITVSITDEFLPFLIPNVYVDFQESSASVSKGKELAANCFQDLEVIENIYQFVTKTIVYDEEKAQSVPYGYIPDPDETLSSERGICFDYASLMTAMLRSQQIPTKLEVGYVGDIYHAWISCYVDEIGWVDHIIEFNGKSWSLLDPTLAANNERSAVQAYIGDGSKYLVKYTY